jgi:DNA-binding IclR family transcriptional regulator
MAWLTPAGLARVTGQLIPGIDALAAPVFDHRGAMVLAGVAWRLADLLAVRGSAERAGARLWLELRGAGLSIGGRL